MLWTVTQTLFAQLSHWSRWLIFLKCSLVTRLWMSRIFFIFFNYLILLLLQRIKLLSRQIIRVLSRAKKACFLFVVSEIRSFITTIYLGLKIKWTCNNIIAVIVGWRCNRECIDEVLHGDHGVSAFSECHKEEEDFDFGNGEKKRTYAVWVESTWKSLVTLRSLNSIPSKMRCL